MEEILDALRGVKSSNKINPTVISLEAFKSDAKNDTLFYKNIKSDSIILHINSESELPNRSRAAGLPPKSLITLAG